jgi:[acyl-carrier-protein] S-malonyltransferase
MRFDAIVFPGQGAQRIGMGMDFIEAFPEAQQVFARANEILPFDVFQVCQQDENRLAQTEYTQACILTTEIAMFRALQKHFALQPNYFAGHSLGEFTALVAAEVIPFEIALELVVVRGKLMQNAPSVAGSGMVALIMERIPNSELKTIAEQHNVDVANDNSITQVVLSGKLDDIDKVIDQAETTFEQQHQLSLRIVPLNVSAPFHSRYMQTIEQPFHSELLKYKDSYQCQHLPRVVSNYLGGFYTDSVDQLIDALTKQLSGSVKWRDNMQTLTSKTHHILELGPNRPLRGFFKTLGINISAVINTKNIEKVFAQPVVEAEPA